MKNAQHLVFVAHGFNLTGVAGTRASVRYCREVEKNAVKALLVRVLWPGDEKTVPVLNYTKDFIDADATGVELCDFLEREGLVANKTIDFVGNSLGNRVALTAMKRLQRNGPVLPTTTLFALASAIGSTLVADPNHFHATVENVARAFVSVSKRDGVL